MNKQIVFSLFLAAFSTGLFAQDPPPAQEESVDKNVPGIRLAYFLAYPREVTVSFGGSYKIQGTMAGSVTSFFPFPQGTLPVEITDRFNKNKVFADSVPVKAGESLNLVVYGNPEDPALPPKTLLIPGEKPKSPENHGQDNKDEKLCQMTFVNLDHKGPVEATVKGFDTPLVFSLKPGEQKTVGSIPSGRASFSLKTIQVEGQYNPFVLSSPSTMLNHNTHFLVLIFRSTADRAAAETFITDIGGDTVYAEPSE